MLSLRTPHAKVIETRFCKQPPRIAANGCSKFHGTLIRSGLRVRHLRPFPGYPKIECVDVGQSGISNDVVRERFTSHLVCIKIYFPRFVLSSKISQNTILAVEGARFNSSLLKFLHTSCSNTCALCRRLLDTQPVSTPLWLLGL